MQHLSYILDEFYPKMDFAIVGVMPDANGIDKPDIYIAK